MAIGNPRPKVSDGIILFGTICLMGAPTVYPHFSDVVGRILFYGGVAGMILYAALRWGAWLWRELTGSASSVAHPFTDNRGGAFVKGDNTGTQQVFHGPVIINSPPDHCPRLEADTGATINMEGSEIPADLPFPLVKASTGARVHLPGLKITRAENGDLKMHFCGALPERESKSPPEETESVYEKMARAARAKPDTKVKDAVNYAVTRNWVSAPLRPNLRQLVIQAEKEFVKLHQYAADGELKIWAYPYQSSVYTLLPPVYWQGQHRIAFDSIFLDATEIDYEYGALDARVNPPYFNHMVNKAQVEALWPSIPDHDVPFHEAATILYEAMESGGVGSMCVGVPFSSPDVAIDHCKYILTGSDLELYGVRPPSRNRILITVDNRAATLIPAPGDQNTLRYLHASAGFPYHSVTVKKSALDAFIPQYVEYLREIENKQA